MSDLTTYLRKLSNAAVVIAPPTRPKPSYRWPVETAFRNHQHIFYTEVGAVVGKFDKFLFPHHGEPRARFAIYYTRADGLMVTIHWLMGLRMGSTIPYAIKELGRKSRF